MADDKTSIEGTLRKTHEEKERDGESRKKSNPEGAVEDTSSKSDDELDEKSDPKTAVDGTSDKEKECNGKKDEKMNGDSWIKRSPALIRLTSENTFNSEPPLTWLMNNGFITPVSLHYVRNHGSVPRANWNEWTVEVCGMVDRPTIFSMTQLVNDFEPLELPVTLVCSGNRRKEHNMVKDTNGFHWGAAALSTSVWLGSPLRVVLERCGIQSSAVYVCFEGAEVLPGSKYGTSLRKEIAMDPTRDIILAYKQNGEDLEPDHGHPVRVIIPGFIGGRMVKWLKKIIVTTKESESCYHFKDNRVLPSHVDSKLADAEGWWYKPEYIINELNINSVITSPYHGEFLPSHSSATKRPYKLKGYAYSGGGRKVTRVEVTMDDGLTWHICEIDRRENPTKYGKYWCWCFWSLEVDIPHLHEAKEIAVRAWDEALNTQPEKLIWNVLGMMNNCWFRVKVKANACNTHKGEIRLRFEHPTIPGAKSGGWMAPQEQGRKTMKNSLPCKFSMSDVEEHNSNLSAWVVVRGHVYDCTELVDKHSGGPQFIVENAGTDGTEGFDSYEHSDEAKAELENYRIGELRNPSDAAD